jgi:glycosyltransferase involved in cell wall biosynthesis
MIKNSVCLNMIVKNERKVIERCFNSVKSLIDYWVIVDTGSDDGTQQTIQECMKGIPGRLYERPWVHFAHNRNEALFLAKNRGDYLLFIDADDWLQIPDGFKLPQLSKDYYAIEFRHGNCRSMQVLLVNNQIDWKWEGVVHEAIDYASASGFFLKGIVKNSSYDGKRSDDMRKKNLRDAQTLEIALKDEPSNSRYVLHLGGCYEAGQENVLALQSFEKRAQMGGDPLEIYFSLYRIAALQEKLGVKPEIFINSYLKAYLYRPHRLEPLYCLANYFIQTNCPLLGYLMARFALTIPFLDDFYFTQYPIYEYGLKDQLAQCAARLGIIIPTGKQMA